MIPISFNDPRSHDHYDIYLTPTLEFDFCRRHPCAIGVDPITYDTLSEVPQPTRNLIEHQIELYKRANPRV